MLKKLQELLPCRRKPSEKDIFLPMKRPKDCLTCAICHEVIVSSRTLPCGDSFCEVCITEHFLLILKCPICGIDCHKFQGYPCYLLDEAAGVEEKTSSSYCLNMEKFKEYKNKLRIKDFDEGTKVDIKDTEGIWCSGTIKTILKIEKNKFVLVHYDKWDDLFDELLPVESARLAIHGTYTSRNILRYKLPLPDGNRSGEEII